MTNINKLLADEYKLRLDEANARIDAFKHEHSLLSQKLAQRTTEYEQSQVELAVAHCTLNAARQLIAHYETIIEALGGFPSEQTEEAGIVPGTPIKVDVHARIIDGSQGTISRIPRGEGTREPYSLNESDETETD